LSFLGNTPSYGAFFPLPGSAFDPAFPTSPQLFRPECRKSWGMTFQFTTMPCILSRFLSSLATYLEIETQIIHRYFV
jgi:hypothetical protein